MTCRSVPLLLMCALATAVAAGNRLRDRSTESFHAMLRAGHSDCGCADDQKWLPSVNATAPNGYCMDTFEAPNVIGEVPFVMFDLYEGEAWCQARDKRLCYDDEWHAACSGPATAQYNWTYPYGDKWLPGDCNDNKTWRQYNQSILNFWPDNVSTPNITSLSDLYETLEASNKITPSNAMLLVDHLAWLYQANIAGSDVATCTSPYGVVDTCGNVEEWTMRRDGGSGQYFHGNLKGRYWADTRTCWDKITTHGDLFRFYEIGFRCCNNDCPSDRK